MSLLNSILSSINGDQPAPPRSQTLSTTARSNPPSRNPTPQQAPPKRKADDAASNSKPKVARTDTNTSRSEQNTSLAPPPSRSTTSSPAQRALVPPPKAAIPYRGSGPSAKVQTTTKPSTTQSAPVRPSAVSTTSSTVSAPAKGGYLAVLEAAKQNAEAAKLAGQIKHKPVEKLTKKDRQRLVEEARAAQKGKPLSKDAKAGLKARGKSAEPLVDAKSGIPAKDKRKPVEVAYKGTMRSNAPAAPAYRGTMGGPGGAAARKPLPNPSASSRSGYGAGRRYASYSDEEEDEDDELEDDYESGSDMEAGVDEMYEEEEASARIARREDALALAEENELKRQKLERKRKLEELASKQKKRTY
ncbi:hypothetical protein QM012_007857 [Aureobasidium pullulans]|uniref:SPT2-domain-containing protein n=1 Tax=Aureobasidium pullulans TaxID=5580 RepID=A0ABR0TKW8_AURPU